MHTETRCTSFHLKLHWKTGGGGESISAEQVENTGSNKQEADSKLIFEQQNTTVM